MRESSEPLLELRRLRELIDITETTDGLNVSELLEFQSLLLQNIKGLLRVYDAHFQIVRRDVAQRHSSGAFWTPERTEDALTRIDKMANNKMEEIMRGDAA